MNKAYETMRGFWLDVNNLQHKKEVPMLGDKKICVAGVEMAAQDPKGGIKNIWIAASSLGNASVYFENNSPSGLGGFTGGAASGPVRDKALRLMQAAAVAAAHLSALPALPAPTDPQKVMLFACSGEGQIFAQELPESEVRQPQHPLYGFFAYTQQLLGAFRAEQEKTAAAHAAPKPPVGAPSVPGPETPAPKAPQAPAGPQAEEK